MQVEALVVKSECVEVHGLGFWKERCDSSRSLSKFLQLASNNFPRTQASALAEIKVILDREHVTASDAGCALLSLENWQSLEERAMEGNQFGEHHGHKRHADDELESNHNISTHFKKLRISITSLSTSI
jgi:hypothetical protein